MHSSRHRQSRTSQRAMASRQIALSCPFLETIHVAPSAWASSNRVESPWSLGHPIRFLRGDEPRVSRTGEGCVFALPDDRNYMALFAFSTQSAREAVRDEHGLDWLAFTAALQATRPGNGGALNMLPYFDPEIVPAKFPSNCGSPSIRPHRRTGQSAPSPRLRPCHPRFARWMGIDISSPCR